MNMDTSKIVKNCIIKLPVDGYILDIETRTLRVFTEDEAKRFIEGKPWLTIIKLK